MLLRHDAVSKKRKEEEKVKASFTSESRHANRGRVKEEKKYLWEFKKEKGLLLG
jgi:hypothetical protein